MHVYKLLTNMEFLTTLNDHLKGKSKAGAGAQSVLTASEEREIALTCKTLADMSQENWCRWSFIPTRQQHRKSFHWGSARERLVAALYETVTFTQ